MNVELLNTAKAGHIVYLSSGRTVEVAPNKPTRVDVAPRTAANLKHLQDRGSTLKIRGADEEAEHFLATLPPPKPKAPGPRKFQPDPLKAALAVAKKPDKIEVEDQLLVEDALPPAPEPRRGRRRREE